MMHLEKPDNDLEYKLLLPDEGVHVQLLVLYGSSGNAPPPHSTQLTYGKGLQAFRVPIIIRTGTVKLDTVIQATAFL